MKRGLPLEFDWFAEHDEIPSFETIRETVEKGGLPRSDAHVLKLYACVKTLFIPIVDNNTVI